jgi:hypothetical protein
MPFNIVKNRKSVIKQVYEDTAPNRARLNANKCKNNTAEKGIKELRGVLVHQCEKQRAYNHRRHLSVRHEMSHYDTAEQKFLAKRGNYGN